MNPKQNRRWLLTTLLAIASAAPFVSTAQAQQVAAGSFTLPYTVHWGLARLPPGRYTLLARPTADSFMLAVRGTGTTRFILAQGQHRLTGERSSLHIVRHGNQAAVSSLDLAYCGTTFEYATRVPRQIEEKQASNKTVTSVAEAEVIDIPVTASGQ